MGEQVIKSYPPLCGGGKGQESCCLPRSGLETALGGWGRGDGGRGTPPTGVLVLEATRHWWETGNLRAETRVDASLVPLRMALGPQ